MNFSSILGVATGLAFTYLLLSLICSTVQEWIAAILYRRAANLRKGLLSLVSDENVVKKIYEHPLVDSLVQPKSKARRVLAYMPSNAFAIALIDTVCPQLLAPVSDVSRAIDQMVIQPPELQRILKTLAYRANGEREAFLRAVESWFDDTMNRVSGWYKRETQLIIILLAIIATTVINVDSIRIAQELYQNAGLRDAVNAAASQYIAYSQHAQTEQTKYAATLQKDIDTLTSLQLPIGPINGQNAFNPSGTSIAGWLLTIAAVSLGAPFWFDVLVRVANLRNNGPRPGTSQQGGKQ